MVDIIACLVLAAVLIAAGVYIWKARKRGQKCIGCPYAKECAARASGCGCSAGQNQ